MIKQLLNERIYNVNPRGNATIFVFVNPAWGHINPLLPVIEGLVSHGFRIRVYCGSGAVSAVVKAGAECIPCDRFFIKGLRYGFESFGYPGALEGVLDIDPFIAREISRYQPVCALVDTETIWGILLAEKYHLYTICFSATMLRTLYVAGDYWGDYFKSLEPWEEKLQRQLDALVMHGFPPKTLMSLLCADESKDYIAAVSEIFQPYSDMCPAERVYFIGQPHMRPLHPIQSAKESEKETDFVHRRPLLYVTQGTLANVSPQFFKSCITAFKDLDVDVIMAVWKYVNISELGPIPEHIKVYEKVDQDAVLKRADAAIFHGGMNTVTDCLLQGVPMAIYPTIFDQSANAKRVTELGAGTSIDTDTPAAIKKAALEILYSPDYQARSEALAREIRKSSGPEGAVKWIIRRIS